ncbi:MAG: DNA internalization-related competence protein ComEC/Rec2 [Bacilli bacterium]|nr:DNA internalization-related competence protein ComEC/Rec2 [Bacilli bacterium]
MTKLKIVLKYKYLILFLVVLFSFFVTNNYDYKSKYNGNEKNIEGYVLEKKINNKKSSLVIKGKEKVLVNIYNRVDINYHDYVSVNGILSKPNSNTIFNLFNYKRYLKEKRINYIFTGKNIKVIRKNNNIFYSIKNLIEKRINKYKSKKYLKVFILSEKNDLDKNIKDVYKNLGIVHLLSISGSYIAILVFIMNKIIKNKKIISILLITYIALTNYQISILRTVLCYILFLLNKRYKLGIDKESIIILLASFLLLMNPYYLYNIGFLLSFFVSFSLIHFSYLLENRNYIQRSLIISFIAFFISLPIIINTYFSINFLSILFNLIYVPFSCFVLYPLSLLTFLFPMLDSLLYILTKLFENLSLFLNKMNYFTLSFSKIPLPFYIIYYYLIFKKNNKFLLLVPLLYLYNYYLFIPRIYFLDVGQGDSALIRYKNKNIIIDTGGSYDYDNSDNLVMFYKSVGVKKIDEMYISHGDLDHIGNAYNITKKIKTENIYINKYNETNLEKELCSNNCKKVGEDFNRNMIKVLNPSYNMYDENDNSLVIYISINNKNILFMGDSSKEVEYRLMNTYNIGKIDILKVGHHGSNTSSSKAFIKSIKPKYSVISVGKNNRYGHPNKEVLNNLDNSKIFRTDEDGSIMFKIKNNELKIETCSS